MIEMKSRLRPRSILPAFVLLSCYAAPAAAWEARVVERDSETACVVIPEAAPFLFELAELPDRNRRTRIFIARSSGLEGGSSYFLAIDGRQGVKTKTGTIEGKEAADFVYEMLEAEQIVAGFSRGNRPLEQKLSLALDGFSESFWECLTLLGWHSEPKPRVSPAAAVAAGDTSRTPVDPRIAGLLESAVAASLPEELVKDLATYGGYRDQRAFAVAADADGPISWGYSHGYPEIEAAVDAALGNCRAGRREHHVTSECRVLLVGSAQVGQFPDLQPTSERQDGADGGSAVRYETRWVEGRSFVVGSTEEAQVWVSFSTAGGPHAVVYLANTGESALTFTPEDVRANAVQIRRGDRQLVPMTTFSAEEYEQKERRQQVLIAALHGIAAGMANQPQPVTSSVQGTASTRANAFGSGGYATARGTTSFSGTITTWPTARDYAEAQARTQAQIATMAQQLQASFEAVAQSLARKHTLPPSSFYGGVVRFRRQRGDEYRVEIPFGETTFAATFTVD